MGVRRPRTVRLARDLRSADRVQINREMVTVEFVSSLPARVERRALEMMTRGRDLDGTVIVEGRNEQGRTIRHEFDEHEVVSIY